MFQKYGCTLQILKVAHLGELTKDVPEISSTAERVIAEKSDDFVYAWTRAVTADVPNLNGDVFTLEELKKAYPTFIGRGLHLDHNTSSVASAVGKIFDAKLLKDPFAKNGEGDWYVGCLIGIDTTTHPDIAKKVKSGVIDSVSMGASVEKAKCGICGKVCSSPEQFCKHLQNLGKIDPETGKKCTSINEGVTFTELSLVGVPADPMAKMQQVFASFISSSFDKKANFEDTKTSLTEKFSFSIPCGNEKICEMLYNELEKYSGQGISDLRIEGPVLTVSVEALNQDLALRKLKNISDEQGLVVKEPVQDEEILMSTQSNLKVSAEELRPMRLDFKGSKEDAEELAKKFDLKLNDYHKDEDGKTKVTFEGTKENLEKLHNIGFFDFPENEKEFIKFHEEPESHKKEEEKEASDSSEEVIKEAKDEDKFKEEIKVEDKDNPEPEHKEEFKEDKVIEEKEAAPSIADVVKAEDAVVTKETLNAPNSTETDAVIAENQSTTDEMIAEAAPEKVEEEKLKVKEDDDKKEVKKDFKENIKGPQEEKKEEVKETKKEEDKKVGESDIKEAVKKLEDMLKQEPAEGDSEDAKKLREVVDILKGKKEEFKEEKKVEEVKKEDGKEDKVKEDVKIEDKPLPKESTEVVNNDIPMFASVERIALFKSANLLGSKWLFKLKGSANPVIVSVKDLIDSDLDNKLAYFTSEAFKNDLMKGISSKAEFTKDTVMEVVAGFNEKIKVKPDEAASHIEHSNVKVKEEKDDFVNKGGKTAPEPEVSPKSTDDGKKQTEEKVNKKEEKSAVTYSSKKAPSETDMKMLASLKNKVAYLQSKLANSEKNLEQLKMSNLIAAKESKCKEIVSKSIGCGLVQLNEEFRKEAFEKCASPKEAKEIAWKKTADAMVHDLLALDDADLDSKLQALSHFKVQAEVKEVVKPFHVQASVEDSAQENMINALINEMY